MSIPYVETGRTNQKRRTMDALVDAARELIASGTTPTVEDAASTAGISRTTAYRYFQNQRELLVAAYPQLDAASLLDDDAPDDVTERVTRVVERIIVMTIEWEPALRAMLRLSLEHGTRAADELLLRRGRAIEWLRDAVAPLRGRADDDCLERLVLAIRASAGIESFVWLRDVAGLPRDEAARVMTWAAQSLVETTLRQAGIEQGS